MKVTASITWAVLARAGTALTHTVSWAAAGWVTGMLVTAWLYRLLAEWQRRLTLAVIIQHAPGGTVIVQERGPGGPAMWVQVGYGPRPITPPQITKPGPR